MHLLFSDEDRDRISQAIAEAERQTSGEIVPVVVPRSDTYDDLAWKGAAIGAGKALVAAMLVFQFYGGWGLTWLYTGWGTAILALVAGVIGGLLGLFVPFFKRRLAGRKRMTRAVHRHAMKVFVEEEVFDTRERTGVLLFISLLEHRIEVIGDAGINAKVSADDWVHVVERIREGIRAGRPADGLVEAIGLCGQLLGESGVERREDDVNELSDTLRIRGDG